VTCEVVIGFRDLPVHEEVECGEPATHAVNGVFTCEECKDGLVEDCVAEYVSALYEEDDDGGMDGHAVG
jgi:hypothetical protein